MNDRIERVFNTPQPTKYVYNMKVYFYYYPNYRVKMATRVHDELIVVRTLYVASDYSSVYILVYYIVYSRSGVSILLGLLLLLFSSFIIF